MDDIYYIIGTAYAGKSTMVKLLAEKYDGIACEEKYHDRLVDERLDKDAFPCLCYGLLVLYNHQPNVKTIGEGSKWLSAVR